MSYSMAIACWSYRVYCYELKSFRVRQKNNSYIREIQENSIENSIQDSLSYI